MIGYCCWWTLWLRVVCVWMMCLSGYACRLPHTAPESVKRVKSSAQILDKSFFWRLSATNAFGGSSRHQRTPLLNACQKWSPLMTGATFKCICGAQPPEKWLIHYFCARLFTCPEQCVPMICGCQINYFMWLMWLCGCCGWKSILLYVCLSPNFPLCIQVGEAWCTKSGKKTGSPTSSAPNMTFCLCRAHIWPWVK